ncbi:helix-turn-helix domain-containing protein [Fulvivirgaceae bacterium BMA12]|uniref:Helix-turn-helix domain-containing protein n=1 Tax=Agaribacillus aureus TaxID=3051825 RepID=A0ABT8L395_9BACT|nr:helix-turn-helix domain-containing protein [Fulvivirgaceae bacterium BMA12]
MKIAVLDFPHVVKSSVAGPYDILNQTNRIIETFAPELDIENIEVETLPVEDINNEQKFDLIIIPAIQFDRIETVLKSQPALISWLQKQYAADTEIASICLGTFILAATGLLDNKYATTHWMGVNAFRNMFPKVNLVDDKIVTDFQRLYTCGGAYSFTTLMIYLIDKYFGHEVAVIVSKVFLIHLNDLKQSSFHILNLQKSHNNDSIQKVQHFIETNFHSKLNVEDLAKSANMTTRTFIRRFKKSTGSTPYGYLQKIKIEKSKKLLETRDIGIEQVSYEVGYSDFASFRKVFKKNVGLTPSEYKKLYGKTKTPGYLEIG